MNELTILIIGIGIGYFWAMFRIENIRINGLTVHHHVNARQFFRELAAWAERNGEYIVVSANQEAKGSLKVTEEQKPA